MNNNYNNNLEFTLFSQIWCPLFISAHSDSIVNLLAC